MKTFKAFLLLAFTIVTSSPAQGAPVITSFSQNGELVCSNLTPGSVASVEWAASLSGPWQTNWAGRETVTVGSNGVIQVSVPMFYRVRGVAWTTNPAPVGMAFIPAGSFTMGASLDYDSAAIPLHSVYVSAFYMDKYEVTKSLWDSVYQWATNYGYSFDFSDSGQGKATNHPAQMMTWYDAVKWCNARSEKEGRVPAYYTDAGLTTRYRTGQVDVQTNWVNWGTGYRLPTEAEWEKAARGGMSGKRFPWGDTISQTQANYYGQTSYSYDLGPNGYNSIGSVGGTSPATSPTGSFAANGYGLCDMAGNVWEWCWDSYGVYTSSSQTDPRGPASFGSRVYRGGGWGHVAYYCRTANRNGDSPDGRFDYLGFRSVLPPSQ